LGAPKAEVTLILRAAGELVLGGIALNSKRTG
jgi:hypothetical protein